MTSRCGVISIVGRANVGKSTLLNRLIGQKLSITARKPQTTRHRIVGIRTDSSNQYIFVDTPGLQVRVKNALNRSMNQAAISTLDDVDVVILVVQGTSWTEADAHVLKYLQQVHAPVILAINKIDMLKDRRLLLPAVEEHAGRFTFADTVPISARGGDNIDALLDCVARQLPEREHLYEQDQLTDRGERFFVGEILREKVIRLLGDELPFDTMVTVESFNEKEHIVEISATITVARSGQKPIVIGKGGQMLRQIGEQARRDMEKFLDRKVFLETWVKVKDSWADDARALREMGLDGST